MAFFRISIPGFSLGIFFTYYLQQQKQISYKVECALPTIIMFAVGAIVFVIYNKINPQNELTVQDISIDMSFSAFIFAGCILSINMDAAVLAAFTVIGKYVAFDLFPSMKNGSFHFKESVINLLKSDLYMLQRTMFIGYLILYWSVFIVTNHANSDEDYLGGLFACFVFFYAVLSVMKLNYSKNIRRIKIEYYIEREKEKSSKN